MPVLFIESIKHFGRAHVKKLHDANILTCDDLLRATRTTSFRQTLSAQTSIPEEVLLNYAHYAEFFRIKGIGKQYADLLWATGVDSLATLKRWGPEFLIQKMAVVNRERRIVKRIPAIRQLEKWIGEAMSLPVILK